MVECFRGFYPQLDARHWRLQRVVSRTNSKSSCLGAFALHKPRRTKTVRRDRARVLILRFMASTIATGVGHLLGEGWKKSGEIQKLIEMPTKVKYPKSLLV